MWGKKKEEIPEFVVVSLRKMSKKTRLFYPGDIGEHPTVDMLMAFVNEKTKFIEPIPMNDGYSLEAIGVVFVYAPPILEDGTPLKDEEKKKGGR